VDLLPHHTGNVELTGVSVADDQGEVVSCPQSSLVGGTSMVCTASGTAAAGQYSNTATAGGTPPGGLPAQQAQDTSHYYGAAPGIALAKRVNGLDAGNPPGPYLLPGETVQWHFVVTNTGNITLTGIAVQDNQLGPIACPGGELGPGAAVTCQAQGTVAVGQYVNTATAQATPPVGPALEAEDTAYYFGITPELAIVKCAPMATTPPPLPARPSLRPCLSPGPTPSPTRATSSWRMSCWWTNPRVKSPAPRRPWMLARA
jgi:hypothetical protein